MPILWRSSLSTVSAALLLWAGGLRLQPVHASDLLLEGQVYQVFGTSVSSSFICPFSGVELTLQVNPTEGTQLTPELLQEAWKVIAIRLINLRQTPAAVVPLSNNQLLVQIPGDDDPWRIQEFLTRVGRLEFRPQRSGTEAQLRIELLLRQQLLAEQSQINGLSSAAAIAENRAAIARSNAVILPLFDAPVLTNSSIQDVYSQDWEILLSFTPDGTTAFTDITRSLARTNRTLGIFLDDRLISAPTVDAVYAETGITGGRVAISGSFSEQEANDLVLQLRSGYLPVPVEILSIFTANPSDRCTSSSPSP